MSKEKTIVTGDLVAADWVSDKPKAPRTKMMTQEEVVAATAAAKAKKKKQKK